MESVHPSLNKERRDPVCGMIGSIEKNGNWFCSTACVGRYERGLTAAPALKWLTDTRLWALAIVAGILGLGWIWPAAQPVSQSLWGYLSRGGPAILVGLLSGGIVDHFVPKEYISRAMTGNHRGVVLRSAGLGFAASSCSHGCLALSMELYRKGASTPAVITFLLASPWASLSLTLLIVSLMGWRGLLIVVMALAIAVVSGALFQRLERTGRIQPNPNTVAVAKDFSIGRDLKRRFREKPWTMDEVTHDLRGIARGGWALSRMVLIWVAVGFCLSAVLGSVVPPNGWSRFFGPTFLGLLATLAVATIVEVCSEGMAPLAVELYRQTGALGNAFGFLMGGVVTDATELSLLWGNLGRRVVGWYLLVTLPQVFLWGTLMNILGR